MLEWLNGYFTALEHVSAFAAPLAPSVSVSAADWASALGSVLAAGSAAVAAWLTWKVAKENMISKVETERASILFLLNDVSSTIFGSSRLAKQHATSMRLELVDSDLKDLWDEQILLFERISEDYKSELKHLHVHKDLASAKSIQEIQIIRMGIAGVQQTSLGLAIELSSAQYQADLLRKRIDN